MASSMFYDTENLLCDIPADIIKSMKFYLAHKPDDLDGAIRVMFMMLKEQGVSSIYINAFNKVLVDG